MERNTSMTKSLYFFLSYVWASLLRFVFFWQSQPAIGSLESSAGRSPSSGELRNVHVGYDERLPLLDARPMDLAPAPSSSQVDVPDSHSKSDVDSSSSGASPQVQIEADIAQLTSKIAAINEQMELALRGRPVRVPATATLKLKLRGVLSQVSSLLSELDTIEQPTAAERSSLARAARESAAQSGRLEDVRVQLAEKRRVIEQRLGEGEEVALAEPDADDGEGEAEALWQQLQRKGKGKAQGKALSGRRRRLRDAPVAHELFEAENVHEDVHDEKADLLASLNAVSARDESDQEEGKRESQEEDDEHDSGAEASERDSDAEAKAERERARKKAIAALTSFDDSEGESDEHKSRSDSEREAPLSLDASFDASLLLSNLNGISAPDDDEENGKRTSNEDSDSEGEGEGVAKAPVIFATRDAKTATKDLLKTLDRFKGHRKEASGFDLLRALNATAEEPEDEREANEAAEEEKSDSWSESGEGALLRGYGEAEDVNKAGMRRGKKGKNVKLGDKSAPKFEMEDTHAHFADDSLALALLAVFDGHAGSRCSKRLAAEMPDAIRARWPDVRAAAERGDETALRDWWRALYLAVDATLTEFEYEGATTTTLLLWRDADGARRVQCANVGDSTAFLIRSGEAVWLSEDHKPTAPSERARIAAMGITLEEGQSRLNGLAVSRALGDHFPKDIKCGLIAEPFVSTVHSVDAQCSHLVVASDGLWDVLAPSRVAELCAQHEGSAQELAQRLLKLAVESHKCTDNVTVLVAAL